MKLAFYKGTRPGLQGIYSRGVRFVDRGPYSHCEIVFSDGVAGSASYIDGGVRLKVFLYKPEDWDFVDLPERLEPGARAWFELHKGEPYDLLGNLRFLFWMVRESKHGWFCNEACGAALGFIEPWRLGPNGFAAQVKGIFTDKGGIYVR